MQFLTFFIVFVGVFLLGFSLSFVFKFIKILKRNGYAPYKWFILAGVIIFFIVGFTVFAIDITAKEELAFDLSLLVSVVYFLVSIFVFITMKSIYELLKNLLGDVVSDKKAYEVFLQKVGKNKTDFEFLYESFEINCQSCGECIEYSIADIVRQNYLKADRGVTIQETFGVQSYLLRSAHMCKEGRREIVVAHDQTLAYRSINRSRLILGNKI